jgi:glucosamine-6-phosphate deaminase
MDKSIFQPSFKNIGLIREFISDKLHVKEYENRIDLGKDAAQAVAKIMKELIHKKGKVRMMFASAPSQNDFLKYLKIEKGIDWSKVYAFHMDNYVGLPIDHPQSFSQFLRDSLFNDLPEVNFFPIDSGAIDPESEVKRYKNLLLEEPIDIMILGIGESGHLAFIDPPFCDFNDDSFFKISPLDDETLVQQVHDGCFDKTEDVPKTAYTLTIAACLASPFTIAIVPTALKAKAIRAVVDGPIFTKIPASKLQTKKNAWLLIDKDSGRLLKK